MVFSAEVDAVQRSRVLAVPRGRRYGRRVGRADLGGGRRRSRTPTGALGARQPVRVRRRPFPARPGRRRVLVRPRNASVAEPGRLPGTVNPPAGRNAQITDQHLLYNKAMQRWTWVGLAWVE